MTHLEEKEYNNIYAIPANYTDSGKILGGMLEPRNAVEAVILLILTGYPILFVIPMSGTIRIVVATVTLLPLGVLGDDGHRWRFPVSISRPYVFLPEEPPEITLQEDWISL